MPSLGPAYTLSQEDINALPRTTGVYIFHGDSTLPLYIGKSVDIRSRVLSHLRQPDEVRMMSQTRRIELIETAGEIGALLLEARLIKSLSPLFNVRLRRIRTLYSIRLINTPSGMKPEIISSKNTTIGLTDGLYGLFNSKQATLDKLREIAKDHTLCQALLGLERLTRHGCFGRQIKTCYGACINEEARDQHDHRLVRALTDIKVHVWPYKGPIELVETQGEWI